MGDQWRWLGYKNNFNFFLIWNHGLREGTVTAHKREVAAYFMRWVDWKCGTLKCKT